MQTCYVCFGDFLHIFLACHPDWHFFGIFIVHSYSMTKENMPNQSLCAWINETKSYMKSPVGKCATQKYWAWDRRGNFVTMDSVFYPLDKLHTHILMFYHHMDMYSLLGLLYI